MWGCACCPRQRKWTVMHHVEELEDEVEDEVEEHVGEVVELRYHG